MTYEEIKEISSRFEPFYEQVEEVNLDTENMKEEPEFWYYEATINMKTENGKNEIAQIVINEDPECEHIRIYKNRLYDLTFEQKVEQERAYDVCKGIVKDYLNDSIISI